VHCNRNSDHAQYLAHWLQVLKADKRAILTAASKAGEAVAFLKTDEDVDP
jgi:antirestriction protein ArdC